LFTSAPLDLIAYLGFAGEGDRFRLKTEVSSGFTAPLLGDFGRGLDGDLDFLSFLNSLVSF